MPGKAEDCGVTAKNNRLFIEAVLWIVHAGSPWRDLPSDFGHWHRIYVHYNRWSNGNVFLRQWQTTLILNLMVDRSIVRVHHMGQQKNEQASEA